MLLCGYYTSIESLVLDMLLAGSCSVPCRSGGSGAM
eukprot:COSAG05_NODE_1286_length_5278_cov_4.428461_2_plen_36_part_00